MAQLPKKKHMALDPLAATGGSSGRGLSSLLPRDSSPALAHLPEDDPENATVSTDCAGLLLLLLLLRITSGESA